MTTEFKPDVLIATKVLGESGIFAMLMVTRLMGIKCGYPTEQLAMEGIQKNEFFCITENINAGQPTVTGATRADEQDFIATTPEEFIDRAFDLYATQSAKDAQAKLEAGE